MVICGSQRFGAYRFPLSTKMNPVNGPIVRSLGRALRKWGQALDGMGIGMQHPHEYVEKLVPSTRIVAVKGKEPSYGFQHFVASTASLIGDVKLGEMSSAWYGATIRGDKNSVVIGKNTSILDNAVIVSTKKAPTKLGNDVTIGPGATVFSAEIGDGAMIGMGAVVQSGAKVGNDAFVDAGAIVPAGATVPAGALWTGNPAKQLRMLSIEEMSYLRTTAGMYASLSQKHFEQQRKTPAELEADTEEMLLKQERGLKPTESLPETDDDVKRYYHLTTTWDNSGLFREKEYNLAAEDAAREAEELAADRAEEEYYAKQARLKRVGASLKAIASNRSSAARQNVVAELASMDADGAAMLSSMISEIAAASTAANAESKAAIIAHIRRIDPGVHYYEDEKEATDAATEIFNAVAANAGTLLGTSPTGSQSAQSQLK